MSQSSSPTVLVTGAAGAQGAAIAQAFVQAGWQVRGLARSAASAARVRSAGVHPVIAADGDTTALAAALNGATVLAATLPIDYRRGVREAWLAALLGAARQADVQRLVLNLASRPLPGHDRPVSASMRAMEMTALGSGIPTAVLRPTVYMDNLLQDWALGGARQRGVLAYPVPEDIRIAWISHRSLGAAAVAAATRADAAGRGFDIGGPEELTGPEVAAMMGQALNRPVTYVKLAPAEFGAALNAVMGEPNGSDIGDLYSHLPTVPRALAETDGNGALGLTPESFAAWFARQHWAG
jgi:uncharacterized protein YbjT (DUF2867 family)